MLYKTGDAKIISIINEDDLTEEQKQAVEESLKEELEIEEESN